MEGRPGLARSDRACCSGMRRMFGTSRLRLQGRQAEILRLELFGGRMSRRYRRDTSSGLSRSYDDELKTAASGRQRATEPVLVTSAAIAAVVRFARGVRTLI